MRRTSPAPRLRAKTVARHGLEVLEDRTTVSDGAGRVATVHAMRDTAALYALRSAVVQPWQMNWASGAAEGRAAAPAVLARPNGLTATAHLAVAADAGVRGGAAAADASDGLAPVGGAFDETFGPSPAMGQFSDATPFAFVPAVDVTEPVAGGSPASSWAALRSSGQAPGQADAALRQAANTLSSPAAPTSLTASPAAEPQVSTSSSFGSGSFGPRPADVAGPLLSTGTPSGGIVPEAVSSPLLDIDHVAPGAESNIPSLFSPDGVRFADGVVNLASVDLASNGFGIPWGVTRTWTNATSVANGFSGSGMVVSQLPHLRQDSGGTLTEIANGFNLRYFDYSGGVYTSRFFVQDNFKADSTNHQYIQTDSVGDTIKYNDFTVTPANEQGVFKSFADANGNTISVTAWTTDGKVQEVQRSNGSLIESELYSYISSGSNAGLVSSVVLRRSTNGGTSWTTVRQVAYTYYSGEAHGNTGDLKLAQVEDASGNILDTTYYRYYTGESGGYTHGLKYVFRPDSYARLTATLGTSIDSISDTNAAPYADDYFEYDTSQRVTKHNVAGAGGTTGSGNGIGTFTFAYTASSNSVGYNSWATKTVETLPDNNQDIVYTNAFGEVMLSVYYDVQASGNKWEWWTKFDSSGHAIESAQPSALTGYDDTKADLLNNVSRNYQYLSDTTGLITDIDYGTSTGSGSVLGYYEDTKIQQGETGSTTTLAAQQYTSQSVTGGITIYPIANQTRYRNTDSTGGETVSYSWQFYSGTYMPREVDVTQPVIPFTENGPGDHSGDTAAYVNDSYGRPEWSKDGDGHLFYTAYDNATGGVTKQITDVNTNDTGDFTDLPSGWSNTSGLELITSMVVDGLGRTTKLTDPDGNLTYTVYLDTNYEMRVYPGWQSGSNTTTGPTQDYRYDRPGSYLETLTMSAAPHVTSSAPDGTEAIGNVQSLSRTYANSAGQDVRTDDYFNLSGVTWSSSQYIGTQNTNYYTTQYDFDTRGRQYRTLTPTGTYYKTLYDSLDRPASDWIGTNDGSPGNMTQTAGYTYDTFTPPAAPTLGQTSGGSLAATTYYVKVAYVFNGPVQPASAESSLAVAANKLLTVTSPATVSGATGYNVYVGTSSGKETLQNTSPIAIGTNWTEATSGLTTTGEAPFTNGVGDSDVTQMTQYPGGSAANRVTDYWYDWRDRQMASKEGVQASEDTTTHRPIIYTTYDNLDEVTAVQRYNGDTLTVTPSGGVPQAPASANLRAEADYNYDEQMRLYQMKVGKVDPVNGGSPTAWLNTYYWYNHRSLAVKTQEPGGLVTKDAYDGAGRVTTEYQTDGAGDTAPLLNGTWTSAQSVGTNNVLTQVERGYDAAGNVIQVVTRRRFHDETATGALGNATTAPKARVTYLANYYDAAKRLVTTDDYGTNGAASWTRPSTPDARSDTVLRTDSSYAGDSVDQVQLTGNPTGGTFTLTFNGQTTSAIAYNTSASTVQSALQALSSIGSGNALVAPGTSGGWVVRFAGTLAGAVQSAITGNGSGLTGGTNPSVSISMTSLGGDAGRVQQVTDPRSIVTKSDYDYLGRTVRTVENFAAFAPSNSADKTTEFTYDGMDHTLSIQADLTNGAYQKTGYVYGVTTSGGSGLNSNDILAATQFPDPSTGNPSSGQQESYTVNTQAEQLTLTDRNGNLHTYTLDLLGRVTSDTITTLGTGVDGAVRRIDTAYDGQRNAYLFTSYSDTAGTTIVNQVQRKFNGFGQLIQEWQAHGGAVNTSTTPSVQYTYTEAASANNSRLTTITYPNGRAITYNYATGVDNTISRLTSITDGSTTLESYSYLGLDTVVKRAHPQTGVDLTYIDPNGSTGDAGDKYTGLDRFERVVDQRWYNGASYTDRFQYSYDRDSNRTSRTNVVNTSFNESYSYDNLNQLTNFTRGAHTIAWSLDSLGNFSSTTTDGGSAVNNTFNRQNEETAAGSSTLAFDNNGNLTTDDQGHTLVYDAWNRLVAVKNGGTTLTSYKYDALGRKIVENPGTVNDLYYSDQWQVLEERLGGVTTATIQYVWSPVYVDALIERDKSTQNNGTLDERLYVQQDANWNVTALINTSGTVVERYVYDPYGKPTFLNASWGTIGSSAKGWIYLHQGGRYDTTSLLYNFRMRHYSPTLGRWIQVDPIRFLAGDLNLYRSVGNNPVRYVDPVGLIIEMANPEAAAAVAWAWAALGFVAGAAILVSIDPKVLARLMDRNVLMDIDWRRVFESVGDFLANVRVGKIEDKFDGRMFPLRPMHEDAPPTRPGTRGHPDHQADVNGPGRDQARDQARPGETVETEQPVQGHAGINRRADNQVIGADGRTRVVVESERRPNGPYHKKRVKELEEAGIEVQTRPLPNRAE
jgi:RHS repeat-associated protein